VTITHNEQCLRAKAAVDEYDRQWPNYCQHCGGTGLLIVPGDVVPYGSTTARLPASDEPCPACEEKNLCPRCGTLRVWHDEGNPSQDGWGYHEPCPQCGYVCAGCHLDGASPGRPEHECWCYMDNEWEADE